MPWHTRWMKTISRSRPRRPDPRPARPLPGIRPRLRRPDSRSIRSRFAPIRTRDPAPMVPADGDRRRRAVRGIPRHRIHQRRRHGRAGGGKAALREDAHSGGDDLPRPFPLRRRLRGGAGSKARHSVIGLAARRESPRKSLCGAADPMRKGLPFREHSQKLSTGRSHTRLCGRPCQSGKGQPDQRLPLRREERFKALSPGPATRCPQPGTRRQGPQPSEGIDPCRVPRVHPSPRPPPAWSC
ncbi:hypothetical protein SAMN02982994_4588 [Azospirillum lipoferum]|nr:hypothetical protein SAMN02982994_4588 [Azospirillum lipoferum]